jgi:DNA-3-methyladenine glycosylase
MSVLDRSFYSRPTLLVAREMLGKYLVMGNKVGKITETEAYLGPEDLASHARFKSRKRNYLMFKEAGFLYVYFTYGMHYMLNIIAKEEGKAGAVLIRAIQPVQGINLKTDGPGKLTQVLAIDRSFNGLDVTQGALYLEEREEKMGTIITTPRVGIDYAGVYKDKPWRFLLTD